jgi:hypothetical protein
MSLPKPDAIFTHESDLDGLVAGVLLRRLANQLHGGDFALHAYHYSGWKQRDMREKAAWVTDMAFEARLDKPGWVVVDHHPAEVQPRQAQLIHDAAKSASLLAYDLCRQAGLGSPALDRLVHLSNVADLFLEHDADFQIANDYANLVRVYGFWNLHDLVQGEIEKLLDHPLLEVMRVKRAVEDPLGFAWSRQHMHEITPVLAIVDTVVGNTNLIIHQLLDRPENPYEVLITLNRGGNNNYLASLRSRKGEALRVALKLQGGGHPNACGATLPRSVKSYTDAVTYLRQVFNPHHDTPLNSLEGIFAGLELARK